QETIGLAITLELPLLILDIQRAGPSTGMPTKPEQGDLLMVMYGRNSESPVPVVAAATPGDCFSAAIEAARIAIKYRTSLLVLSWGGTYGPVAAGVRRIRKDGGRVAHAHLRHLNPFPRNTGDVLRSYENVLVPEINLGHLLQLVRAEFLVDAVGYNRVRGLPLRASEVADAIRTML